MCLKIFIQTKTNKKKNNILIPAKLFDCFSVQNSECELKNAFHIKYSILEHFDKKKYKNNKKKWQFFFLMSVSTIMKLFSSMRLFSLNNKLKCPKWEMNEERQREKQTMKIMNKYLNFIFQWNKEKNQQTRNLMKC